MASASDGGDTLSVAFRGKEIPVSYSAAVTRDQAVKGLASQPFQTWLQRCSNGTGNTARQLCVHSIEIQSVDMFGPRKVGFMKIKTYTTLSDGDTEHDKPLPGICFLRGNAVSILVALFCEDGKVYSLLTDQPRVPLGMASCLELPAGMLDNDAHSVTGIAVQEMQEECGISVKDTDFIDLTEIACRDAVAAGNLPIAALSPSGGACDEFLRYLYLEKKVTLAELEEMRGRLHGLREHGEYITLTVVPMESVWRVSGDTKAMLSLFLVDQLRKEGKLPKAGELATPLDHSAFPQKHDNAQRNKETKSAKALMLKNGVSIPRLAFGLYKVPADERGVDIILQAIKTGYRHFDAATIYGNTATLGKALRLSGIPRSEFYLATKVWNDSVAKGRGAVRESVMKELTHLGVGDGDSYIDLVYIHWPVPGHFVETYRELELLHQEGKIRGLGLSNFNAEEYRELMESAITIPPVVSQFEVSPVMYRADVVEFFQNEGLVVVASKSLGRTSGFEEAPIAELSSKHLVSPAQIMLRWAVQKALVPICKTSHADRMRENRSVHHFSLNETEMEALDALTSTDAIQERNALEATRKSSS